MEEDVSEQVTALESGNKTKKFTTNDCGVDIDQHKFQCSTCKRQGHFRCAMLLPYQLQHYLLTFGLNSCTFISANCVEVPEYLQRISMREQNGVFQEKYQKELQFQERNCNSGRNNTK